MDVQGLAQVSLDMFNDRRFHEKAGDLMDPSVLVVDKPTGQELRGVDGYIQYSEGFINAIPDLKGTVIEQYVDGNRVISPVQGQGNFAGTLQTPQGNFPGKGNPVNIEYQIEHEFDAAGKVVRFATDYDMREFMRQLGVG